MYERRFNGFEEDRVVAGLRLLQQRLTRGARPATGSSTGAGWITESGAGGGWLSANAAQAGPLRIRYNAALFNDVSRRLAT